MRAVRARAGGWALRPAVPSTKEIECSVSSVSGVNFGATGEAPGLVISDALR